MTFTLPCAGDQTAAAQNVIKLGVVGPLTGQFAAVGQSQLYGAEMRVKELNALAGAFQAILDHDGKNLKVIGREIKCKSQGNPWCEFVVEPLG